jgi:hypothetical protein
MDPIAIIKSSLLAFVSSIARNLIVSGLAWLAARKVIDATMSNQILQWAPIFIAGCAWSLIEKYVLAKENWQRIITALNLAPGSTLAHLDEAIRKQKETTNEEQQ